MLVEIRQSGSEQLLDRVELDEPPSPGRWFLHDDDSFLVMSAVTVIDSIPVAIS